MGGMSGGSEERRGRNGRKIGAKGERMERLEETCTAFELQSVVFSL